MASSYYDSAGKSVSDGDIAYAADLNTINTAVDTGFQLAEAAIVLIGANQSYYSDLAQKWAEEVENTPVTVGHYSALHWASKAEDQAILADADRVQTGLDKVATAADRVNTNNDKIATAADRIQTGADRVATAADRIQTGADRVVVEDLVSELPIVPVGVIVSFVGGYFTNGSNGGFTSVLGDSVAAVNALLNADGWYVCNGAALNKSGSSVFNGSGRYLPNLADGRFLMGSTGAGLTGGANAADHTHYINHTHTTGNFTLTIATSPSHQHSVVASNSGLANANQAYASTNYVYSGDTYVGHPAAYGGLTGGGQTHNHGSTSWSALGDNSGGASTTENRPVFLTCFYIMKVI